MSAFILGAIFLGISVTLLVAGYADTDKRRKKGDIKSRVILTILAGIVFMVGVYVVWKAVIDLRDSKEGDPCEIYTITHPDCDIAKFCTDPDNEMTCKNAWCTTSRKAAWDTGNTYPECTGIYCKEEISEGKPPYASVNDKCTAYCEKNKSTRSCSLLLCTSEPFDETDEVCTAFCESNTEDCKNVLCQASELSGDCPCYLYMYDDNEDAADERKAACAVYCKLNPANEYCAEFYCYDYEDRVGCPNYCNANPNKCADPSRQNFNMLLRTSPDMTYLNITTGEISAVVQTTDESIASVFKLLVGPSGGVYLTNADGSAYIGFDKDGFARMVPTLAEAQLFAKELAKTDVTEANAYYFKTMYKGYEKYLGLSHQEGYITSGCCTMTIRMISYKSIYSKWYLLVV